MKPLILSLMGALCATMLFSQTLPADRKVDWLVAGLPPSGMPNFSTTLNVTQHRITPNKADSGIVNTRHLNKIIDTSKKPVILYFPDGNYYFDSSILVSRDSILFKGQSMANTKLFFNGHGAGGDIFQVRGSLANFTTQAFNFKKDALKGSDYVLKNNNPLSLSSNYYIRIFQNDSSLVPHPPYKVVGQVARIRTVIGDTVYLKSKLRKNFTLAENARFTRMSARAWIGFEDFKVTRVDSTATETSNFSFFYAANCWLRRIESEKTNVAHVVFDNTLNCLIEEVYFHDSHNYRGNPFGQGIGILLNKATSECRIQNSIFKHLRQGVLFQQGANGNVYAYNYSTDPYWYDPNHDLSPTNRAPDIDFHGHYTFANLVEGNIAQNILMDREHGDQGPYNTLLRNRAELFGIKMLNFQTHYQNFLGNEVTHDSTFYQHPNGPIQYGDFTLAGNNHIRRGNLIRCRIDSIGSTCDDLSFAYASRPAFIPASQWAGIGWPNTINSKSNPARDRYCSLYGTCSTTVVSCGSMLSSPVQLQENASKPLKSGKINVYPNPTKNIFNISLTDFPPGNYIITLYNSSGQLENAQKIPLTGSNIITISPTSLRTRGLFLLKIEHANSHVYTSKSLIIN